MKTLLTLSIIFFLSSCAKENSPKKITKQAESSPSAELVMPSSTHIVSAYLKLKDAFVASNQDNASTLAKEMLAAYTAFNADQLISEKKEQFIALYENSKEHLEHIAKSDLDHQRSHFKKLSIDTYELVQMLNPNLVLYKQYCPMYNKNKGGMWLSAAKEIRNPYFGDKMLKCGSVREKITL